MLYFKHGEQMLNVLDQSMVQAYNYYIFTRLRR